MFFSFYFFFHVVCVYVCVFKKRVGKHSFNKDHSKQVLWIILAYPKIIFLIVKEGGIVEPSADILPLSPQPIYYYKKEEGGAERYC